MIIGVLSERELNAPAVSLAYELIICTLIFLVISVLFIALIARRLIVAPLRSLINSVEDLVSGNGDLTHVIEIKSHDELGELAGKFNTFIGYIRDVIIQVTDSADSVVSGNTQLAAAMEEISSIFAMQAQKISVISEQMQFRVKFNGYFCNPLIISNVFGLIISKFIIFPFYLQAPS